jgi:hypothetical protein
MTIYLTFEVNKNEKKIYEWNDLNQKYIHFEFLNDFVLVFF